SSPKGGDAAPRETIAAFRVPHTGYFALHDAKATSASGDKFQVRIYVGDEASPRYTSGSGQRIGLNIDIGYVKKGDVIYVAFGADSQNQAKSQIGFNASVIEWAPRRAPLRVHREKDGYLAVIEPADQRRAIAIPAGRWVEIPAQTGDATEAIRNAI